MKKLLIVGLMLTSVSLIHCGSRITSTEVVTNAQTLNDYAQTAIDEEGWHHIAKPVYISFNEDLGLSEGNEGAVASAWFYPDHGVIRVKLSVWDRLSDKYRVHLMKHEIGHALLDLPHSDDPCSYMYWQLRHNLCEK